jgi:hypothetical protein
MMTPLFIIIYALVMTSWSLMMECLIDVIGIHVAIQKTLKSICIECGVKNTFGICVYSSLAYFFVVYFTTLSVAQTK